MDDVSKNNVEVPNECIDMVEHKMNVRPLNKLFKYIAVVTIRLTV